MAERSERDWGSGEEAVRVREAAAAARAEGSELRSGDPSALRESRPPAGQ